MQELAAPLTDLLSNRLILLSDLVRSLELSQIALTQNDAEKIARGASRQAELCRHWSLLEEELRRSASSPTPRSSASSQIEEEFSALIARIHHLTRVHCSLLRHLQRSLSILAHTVQSCSPTYAPVSNSLRSEPRPQAGD